MVTGIDRSSLNVLQLSLSFLVIFFAFNSQGFIESTVVKSISHQSRISDDAGYISLAIIYAVATLVHPFSASIVVLLGARWSLFVGGVPYVVFLAGFLFFNGPFLYVSSAFLGAGGAVIWTAQGKYLALNSNAGNAAKHSHLFWSICQLCILGGGLFLFFVFRNLKSDDKIPESQVRSVYAVFTGAALLGVGSLALLQTPSHESLLTQEKTRTQKEIFASIIRLCRTRRILLLVPAWIFMGVETSFWSAIYPTCLSFTTQLGPATKSYVAFNAMANGFGQASAGLLFGVMSCCSRTLGRVQTVLLGAGLQLVAYIAILLNFPAHASLNQTDDCSILGTPRLSIALMCGFLLGFGDSCWNTQMLTFLVAFYNKQSAEVFTVFKMVQALLTSSSFFYGTKLNLRWHLAILVTTSIGGVIGFTMANRRIDSSLSTNDRSQTLAEVNDSEPSQSVRCHL